MKASRFRDVFVATLLATAAVTSASAALALDAPPALTDIHDIRGPIAIPYWWLRPALALAALALVALGFALYRVLRRRVGANGKSAAETAIERIERARALVGTGRAAEFSAELSNAVRDYIEARLGLRAAHRTTEEFLHDLVASRTGAIAGQRDSLEDFLSGCDLAKFARFALAAEQMAMMVDAARRFVETTEEAAKASERASVTPSSPSIANATPEVAS